MTCWHIRALHSLRAGDFHSASTCTLWDNLSFGKSACIQCQKSGLHFVRQAGRNPKGPPLISAAATTHFFWWSRKFMYVCG
jgi:hypothetical protein